MKVVGWRAKDVFQGISDQAFANAEIVMDNVVSIARNLCPVGTISRPQREGGKEWTERKPGSLRATIRRVSRKDKNNIRVYAGNKKIFYARFVEYGTVKMRKKPFIRPAFQQVKGKILRGIKNGK